MVSPLNIRDDDLNPWLSVPSQPPYVLQCDRNPVAEYNAKCRAEEHRLQTDVLPEPFIGRTEASVVLLNLNPGFAEQNLAEHAQPEFQALLRKNYSHVPSAFPFYYLDPTIESSSGGKWWNGKLKELIHSCGGPRQVANELLCVEYFPYHSRRFRAGRIMPSQKYGFDLVKNAIARNAFVVIMRSRARWERTIAELKTYHRKSPLNSPQNPAVSCRNCPEFAEIVSAICKNKLTSPEPMF